MIGFHGSMNDSAGAGLSPNLWRDFPLDPVEQIAGPRTAVFIHDRFVERPFTVPTTEANFGRYKGFSDTGGLMSIYASSGGGIILGSDGDNEGSSIATVALPFKISANEPLFCFECQIKASTIADTKNGFFVGLLDAATLSATVPIAAAGTLADENFVGFHRLEGDGDYVDTVYKANGVTQVTVKSDARVLVADTFVKLGMRFSPEDNKLRFFANGVELPDTKTIPDNTGTDFPADVQMGIVAAVLNATGSTPGDNTLRWWAAGQVIA